jgi:hypothetical protein
MWRLPDGYWRPWGSFACSARSAADSHKSHRGIDDRFFRRSFMSAVDAVDGSSTRHASSTEWFIRDGEKALYSSALQNVAPGPSRHFAAMQQSVAFGWILLQKSKVAGLRIFRENTKREATADSYNLNRVAEVAGGFDVRRRGPSHLYTKAAPVARRIFDHQCKTTFATVSGVKRTSRFYECAA